MSFRDVTLALVEDSELERLGARGVQFAKDAAKGGEVRREFLLCVALCGLAGVEAQAARKNGFELDDALIAAREIWRGRVPRDVPPAIVEPAYSPAEHATFLDEEDSVLGIVVDGVAKAYPIRILNWHEVVNDWGGETRFVVTYCSLCGSGMAFAADLDGEMPLGFGVSGCSTIAMCCCMTSRRSRCGRN